MCVCAGMVHSNNVFEFEFIQPLMLCNVYICSLYTCTVRSIVLCNIIYVRAYTTSMHAV